jgi:hypothetical protein
LIASLIRYVALPPSLLRKHLSGTTTVPTTAPVGWLDGFRAMLSDEAALTPVGALLRSRALASLQWLSEDRESLQMLLQAGLFASLVSNAVRHASLGAHSATYSRDEIQRRLVEVELAARELEACRRPPPAPLLLARDAQRVASEGGGGGATGAPHSATGARYSATGARHSAAGARHSAAGARHSAAARSSPEARELEALCRARGLGSRLGVEGEAELLGLVTDELLDGRMHVAAVHACAGIVEAAKKARTASSNGGEPTTQATDVPATAPGSERRMQERMQELRQLLDGGLISPDEFETKRLHILHARAAAVPAAAALPKPAVALPAAPPPAPPPTAARPALTHSPSWEKALHLGAMLAEMGMEGAFQIGVCRHAIKTATATRVRNATEEHVLNNAMAWLMDRIGQDGLPGSGDTAPTREELEAEASYRAATSACAGGSSSSSSGGGGGGGGWGFVTDPDSSTAEDGSSALDTALDDAGFWFAMPSERREGRGGRGGSNGGGRGGGRGGQATPAVAQHGAQFQTLAVTRPLHGTTVIPCNGL